jgi:hypothetical protein
MRPVGLALSLLAFAVACHRMEAPPDTTRMAVTKQPHQTNLTSRVSTISGAVVGSDGLSCFAFGKSLCWFNDLTRPVCNSLQ